MFGGDGDYGGDHCSIDGSGIVEKSPDDLLDYFDAVFFKGGGFFFISHADLGAVVDFVVQMRSMFWFDGLSVREFLE